MREPECDVWGVPEYEPQHDPDCVVMCGGCGAMRFQVCEESCPVGGWSR